MGAYGGGFLLRNTDPSDMTARRRNTCHIYECTIFTTYYYQGSLVTSFHYIMTFNTSFSRSVGEPQHVIYILNQSTGTAVDRPTGSGETPSESAPETETPADGYLG